MSPVCLPVLHISVWATGNQTCSIVINRCWRPRPPTHGVVWSFRAVRGVNKRGSVMYAAGSGQAAIPIVRQACSLGTPQWTCVLWALWLHPLCIFSFTPEGSSHWLCSLSWWHFFFWRRSWSLHLIYWKRRWAFFLCFFNAWFKSNHQKSQK